MAKIKGVMNLLVQKIQMEEYNDWGAVVNIIKATK